METSSETKIGINWICQVIETWGIRTVSHKYLTNYCVRGVIKTVENKFINNNSIYIHPNKQNLKCIIKAKLNVLSEPHFISLLL